MRSLVLPRLLWKRPTTAKYRFGVRRNHLSTSIPASQSQSQSYEWSYVCGPGDRPLIGQTVGQLVDQSASRYADRPAFVSAHQRIRRSFAELKSDVDKLAAGFLSLGLNPGDRIGIWGPNSYEWYLTQFAAGKAGLILVNINPAYQPSELEYCLNKVGVRALVSAESFKTQDYLAMMTQIMPELPRSLPGDIKAKSVPSLRHVIMMSDKELGGTFKLGDIFEAAGSNDTKKLEDLQKKIQMDDPCNIQFTSGTTGNPKGATLSHHNIVNNAMTVGSRIGYDKKPHGICNSVPLYHCFGCVLGDISALMYGAKLTVAAPHFSAEACLKAIEAEKLTSVYGTPTMFVDMLHLQREKQFDLSSVETGIMAGAPCPAELCKSVITELNMKDFVVAYGLTETSPVTLQGFPSDPVDLRATTIGFPSHHTEAKIVDPEGNVVPVDTPGELCTRGYSTMLGYWEDEEKTKEAIKGDRWFHTGDQAVIYSNGYAQIVGRLKDMVIRGGENIYPRELEEVLHSHPRVLEAQVIGVPDQRLGEELCAWIRLRPGADGQVQQIGPDDVKDFCKGKIAHFKIPKYIQFVDSFPTTVTGKIQKFKMREMSIQELGLK